jgi:hypothetical protein
MTRLDELAPSFAKQSAASELEISACEDDLKRRLPESYREFLFEANGGEGPIGNLGYLQLWPVKDLRGKKELYQFTRYAPELIPIGTNGEGEALAIDYRSHEHWLGYVPFADLRYQSFVPISTNFWHALRIIGLGGVFDDQPDSRNARS